MTDNDSDMNFRNAEAQSVIMISTIIISSVEKMMPSELYQESSLLHHVEKINQLVVTTLEIADWLVSSICNRKLIVSAREKQDG